MTAPNFLPFEFLTAADLNIAFADCVSLSATGTQTLASSLNIPSLIATISVQTEQLICTGDLVCTSASAITMPTGTTLERPNVPVFGMIRANSNSGLIEVLLQSGNWANLVTTTAASTPTNPPISMTGPAFGQATSSAIPLGWVNPTGGTGPFNFSVQYRLAGTSNWIVWIQQTEAFSTTVSGLLPGARYEFQVTAFNAAGEAVSPIAASNTIGFLSGGPTNLTASQPTSTTISLTWIPLNELAAYQVQYALLGANSWTNFNGPTTASSTTVTGLAANSTYVFQVIAKTLGSSLESLATQFATTPAATISPNLATGLMTSGVNEGGFTLSWQPPNAGTQPMSYQPQYELVGTNSFANYGPATSQLSVTFANLNSGSGYNVQVVSTNSAGQSISTPIPVTTSTATAVTGAVAGSENSGPGYPQIIAPSVANVVQGSAIAISGITVIDPAAIYSPGTMALRVSCTSGTVTMNDQNGNQINGSGTASISYSSTYSSVSAALSSLVYTASSSGSDNISISLTDQAILTSSLAISVSIAASSGGGGVSGPPGGGPPSNITATGQPTDINGVQANRARSFTDGVGLNVRLEDVGYNANYSQSQAAVVENLINYIGGGNIKLLREECGFNLNPTWMAQIAQNCGVAHYVLTIGQNTAFNSYATVAALMQAMATAFHNFVTAFEGVFGQDQAPIFGETNILLNAAQFQPALYGEAHSLGLLAWQLAPIAPSNNGTFGTPPADRANTSAYPPFSPNGSGAPAFSTDTNGYLSDALTSAKTSAPGVPVVLSNFGWNSFPDGLSNSNLGWVPESVQAAYILETLFSAYKLGASAYVVRELMDVPASLSSEDAGQTFGLINAQGQAKVSAVALNYVLREMADQTSSATSFAAGKLNYTVTNKPGAYGGFVNTGYQDVVFQRSDGTYLIIMWNEQVLNTVGGNNVAINVPAVNITLTFNETAKSTVYVIDPFTSAFTTTNNVTSMTIPLLARPIIVQVNP